MRQFCTPPQNGSSPPHNANFPAVPGLNCAHQNLPYIQVLTVQR